MEESGVPTIIISPYPRHLTGRQFLRPSDLIFHQKIAYYIIKDIGEPPTRPGYPAEPIALEGQTQERVCVIIILPQAYVAPLMEFVGDYDEEEELVEIK